MKLVPLACPNCDGPLPAGHQDVVVRCAACGSHVALSRRGLRLIPATYGYFQSARLGLPGWNPFWLFHGRLAMADREAYRRDAQAKDAAQAFWAEPRRFAIPAWNLTLDEVQRLSRIVTRSQPTLERLAEPPPHASMTPVILTAADAGKLARLVAVDIEAQRRDDLQTFAHELELGVAALWVLADRPVTPDHPAPAGSEALA